MEGCCTLARLRGLCSKHGGYTRCGEEGCTKAAKAGGLCVAHGGQGSKRKREAFYMIYYNSCTIVTLLIFTSSFIPFPILLITLNLTVIEIQCFPTSLFLLLSHSNLYDYGLGFEVQFVRFALQYKLAAYFSLAYCSNDITERWGVDKLTLELLAVYPEALCI